MCGVLRWAAGSRLMASRVIAGDCNVISAVCCTMNNSHADQIRKRTLGKLFKNQWFHRSTGTVIPLQAQCITYTLHSLYIFYCMCSDNGSRNCCRSFKFKIHFMLIHLTQILDSLSRRETLLKLKGTTLTPPCSKNQKENLLSITLLVFTLLTFLLV